MAFALKKQGLVSHALILLLMLFFAVFIGLATAVLPWNMTLAMSLIPIFLGLALALPQYATMLAIFLAFGAVPSFLLPQFSLAGGTVRASELFLFFAVLVAGANMLTVKRDSIRRLQSPYTAPLTFFAVLVVMSSVAALFYFHNHLKYYLYELRVVFFWMILPLILYSVESEKTVHRLVSALILMGALLSLGVIAQFITGEKFLEASRVEQLTTLGSGAGSGVTRSTAGGGIYFILFLVNYYICSWAFGLRNILFAGVFIGLGAMATLATFGRAVWLAEGIAVLFILLAVPIKQKIKIAALGGIGVIVFASGLVVFAPDVAEATWDRLVSVNTEVDHGESYQWRREENAYALKALEKNPIFGVALGGEYQPFRNSFMGPDHTRSIHSAYYALALKFGVLGVLLPIWTLFVTFKIARDILRNTADPWLKCIATTLLATTLTSYITSFTQMEWMAHTGVAFLATSFALMSLVYKKFKKDPSLLPVLPADAKIS